MLFIALVLFVVLICFVVFFFFNINSDRIFSLIVSPKDRKEHYKAVWRSGVEFGRLENADTAADLVGLEICF